MQPYPVLETLFRHNLWANLRLLEVCAALNPDQLETSAVGTYGSIVETLRHIAHAERSYFARISTGQPFSRPDDAQPLSFAEMEEWLRISGEGLVEWASKVRPTDGVDLMWRDERSVQVPKAVILTQAINHATEHRAQIMAILTQLDIEHPDLSSWSYFESQSLDGGESG